MTRAQANLLLLLAAFFWGGGNVAQKTVLEDLGPVFAVGIRSLIGCLFILPFLRWEARRTKQILNGDRWAIGLLSLVFALAIGLQQIAFGGTTVTNASFLVNITVVLTPLVAWAISRKRPAALLWPAMGLSLSGIALMGGRVAEPSWGDLCCIASAAAYSVWIVLLGRVLRTVDRPLMIAASQFAVTAFIGTSLGLVIEPVTWAAVASAGPDLFFLGVFSTGIAFTLQAVAQRATPPSEAAIIMSAECIFGALAAAMLLGERLTVWSGTGATLILGSILLVQLAYKEIDQRSSIGGVRSGPSAASPTRVEPVLRQRFLEREGSQ